MRWSDRLHPLRHPDLRTNGGVTERPRTDLTGDHLTGVKSHPQLEVHTVALLDFDGKPLRLFLDGQGRQAGPYRVVLKRDWRAEHCHDAVAGETADRAAVSLNHCTAARLTRSVMISRSRSAPTAAAMSIECTTSANSTVTCLYSADWAACVRRRTALATELGCRRLSGCRTNRRTARSRSVHRHHPRCGPREYRFTAGQRCPSYRRASPTRSFETLVCRLFRDPSTLPFLVAPNPRSGKRNIRTIAQFESLAEYVYRTVQFHSTLHFWQWRTRASMPLFQPDHH